MSCHSAQTRTQSAPSFGALSTVATVWPSVSLTPVSTAWAGAAHDNATAAPAAGAASMRSLIPNTYPY
jgi:hypothetical protein